MPARIAVRGFAGLTVLTLVLSPDASSGSGPEPPTRESLNIGFIGDSITFGSGCTPPCINAVDTEVAGLRAAGFTVNYVNRGLSGATTAKWLPAGSALPAAIADFRSQGIDTVSVMLGTNDAKRLVATSPQDYLANMRMIVGALYSEASGIKRVILNIPPYLVPGSLNNAWDAESNLLLQQYALQLEWVEGAYRGDRSAFVYFQAHPDQLRDGVHPGVLGHAALGRAWMSALIASDFELPTLRTWRGRVF
jgi:lysophospholipase L1-like esterase